MHLVCGEALYDVFLEQDVESDDSAILRAVAGGAPFNIAVGLARLGAPVALATDISSDALGQRLAARIAAEGINPEMLRRTAPATPMAMVSVGDSGVPSYSFSGLREPVFAPDIAAVMAQHGRITNLHIGSVALVLPTSSSTLRTLARDLGREVAISFDPNVRLTVEPDTRRWREVIETTRAHAHLVKVSEEDIQLVYGNVDPEELCSSWVSAPTELVVLTQGARGATFFTPNLRALRFVTGRSNVVDTVSAGDSFMSALLAAMADRGHLTPGTIAAMSEDDIVAVGEFATTAAALTCSRRGPVPPYRDEVLAALTREFGKGPQPDTSGPSPAAAGSYSG